MAGSSCLGGSHDRRGAFHFSGGKNTLVFILRFRGSLASPGSSFSLLDPVVIAIVCHRLYEQKRLSNGATGTILWASLPGCVPYDREGINIGSAYRWRSIGVTAANTLATSSDVEKTQHNPHSRQCGRAKRQPNLLKPVPL